LRRSRSAADLAPVLRATLASIVHQGRPDLSALQLAVFLTCYLESRTHTGRSLATELGVSKSRTTRALDRLTELGLVRLAANPADLSSALLQQTRAGASFMEELSHTMAEAIAVQRANPCRRPWYLLKRLACLSVGPGQRWRRRGRLEGRLWWRRC
jgi:DNA-binding MarR family transcriptional regulator